MRTIIPAVLGVFLSAAAPDLMDLTTWYGIRLGATAPMGLVSGGPSSALLDAPKPWDAATALLDDHGRISSLTFVLYGSELVSDDPKEVLPRSRSIAEVRAAARMIEADLRRRLGPSDQEPTTAGEIHWAHLRSADGLLHHVSYFANDDLVSVEINAPELPGDSTEANH